MSSSVTVTLTEATPRAVDAIWYSPGKTGENEKVPFAFRVVEIEDPVRTEEKRGDRVKGIPETSRRLSGPLSLPETFIATGRTNEKSMSGTVVPESTITTVASFSVTVPG